MDQKKIGDFLKSLRQEKGLTQTQLADILYVSNRSISRWEQGNGLPDIDLLLKLAHFYDVKLEEILDGQRNNMDNKMDSTVLKVAELENDEKKKMIRIIQVITLISLIFLLISYLLSDSLGQNDIIDFIFGFGNGLTFGTLVLILIITSRWGIKIKEFKKRIIKNDKRSTR